MPSGPTAQVLAFCSGAVKVTVPNAPLRRRGRVAPRSEMSLVLGMCGYSAHSQYLLREGLSDREIEPFGFV